MADLRHKLISLTLTAAVLGAGLISGSAWAGCNEIPLLTTQKWRGFKGTVDSVYGRPDSPSPVPAPDPRDIRVDSNTCSPTTLGDDDYAVTVIFKPPRVGSPSVVVLTAGNNCNALTCDNGSTFHCVSGADAGIAMFPAQNWMKFRFPDTDGLFLPAGDRKPFTGPALIAVTPADQPLPCKLAAQRCQDPGGPANAFACVDEIFDVATCGTGRGDLDDEFEHFTALPPMNDWQQMCKKGASDPPPHCTDKKPEVLFTVDRAGNISLPVDWAQVLEPDAESSTTKKNRVVEGQTDLFKTKNGTNPIVIPANGFLGSFTPKGGGWPSNPVFNASSSGNWLVLSGESDVDESVLKISRRKLWNYDCKGGTDAGQACDPASSGACAGGGACTQRSSPAYFACEGGGNAGAYCTQSSDCSGGQCTAGSACVAISGIPASPPPPPKSNPPCYTDLGCNINQECGLGLFEFRDRLENLSGSQPGMGPAVIKKGRYKAKAK